MVRESDDCALEWERVYLQFQTMRREKRDAYRSLTSMVNQFASDIGRSAPYVWRVVRAGDFYLKYRERHPEAPDLKSVLVGDEAIAYIARFSGSEDEADDLMGIAMRDGLSKTDVIALTGTGDRSGRRMRNAPDELVKALSQKRKLLSLVEPSKLLPALAFRDGALVRFLKARECCYEKPTVTWAKAYDVAIETDLVLDTVVAIGIMRQGQPSKLHLVAIDVFSKGDLERRAGVDALRLCMERGLCDQTYALCTPSFLEGEEEGELLKAQTGLGILVAGKERPLEVCRPYQGEEPERTDRSALLTELVAAKSTRISRRVLYSSIPYDV